MVSNTHCNMSWLEFRISIPNIQNMTYVLQRLFMNGILQYNNNNSISRICQKERFIDTIMANILYWFWVICAMLSIKPARDIKMKRGKVFFFNFFIHPSKNAAVACSFKRLCIRYLLQLLSYPRMKIYHWLMQDMYYCHLTLFFHHHISIYMVINIIICCNCTHASKLLNTPFHAWNSKHLILKQWIENMLLHWS